MFETALKQSELDVFSEYMLIVYNAINMHDSLVCIYSHDEICIE